MKANKKLALVTGYDTSVIARETSNLLLQSGYEIIAICKDIQKKQDEKNILYYYADLFCPNSVNTLIEKLKIYHFDAIINCHAVLAETETGELRHEFFNFEYDTFDSIIRSNVTSIAAICIGLKDNIIHNGSIINVTSSAANEGAFATISYNASKAAIQNLSKSLSNNFGVYNGVRVNCVAPGWIPQNKNVVAGNIVDLANKITPLKQYGEATNVACAILSMMENPYANNVVYGVDGGITSSYLMYMLESLDLLGENTTEIMRNLTETVAYVKDKLSDKKD